MLILLKSPPPSENIPVFTLYDIFKKYCNHGIYFLKIDTEGHDVVILKKFHDDIQNNIDLPHIIHFESNILSNQQEVDQTINLFLAKGYDLKGRDKDDTILKLNLQSSKVEK